MKWEERKGIKMSGEHRKERIKKLAFTNSVCVNKSFMTLAPRLCVLTKLPSRRCFAKQSSLWVVCCALICSKFYCHGPTRTMKSSKDSRRDNEVDDSRVRKAKLINVCQSDFRNDHCCQNMLLSVQKKTSLMNQTLTQRSKRNTITSFKLPYNDISKHFILQAFSFLFLSQKELKFLSR